VLCLLVAGQGAAAAADQWDGACAQPGLQQPIAAPTVPAWNGVRLGIDHVAGISQGAGQVIAILDTGVSEVPALSGAVRPAIDLLAADSGFVTAGQPTADAQPADPAPVITPDCDGRGTVLAGLVAAHRDVGLVIPGLARAAEILPIRVAATAGDQPEPQVLADGVGAAVTGGATVVLVAGTVRDDPALQTATRSALAAGVPVIAAAGEGDDQQLAFPAAYDGVISVAATGPNDEAHPVNAVGHVTVGAPGVDLVGLGLDGGYIGGQSGSPVAAAAVAAVVADLRARFPLLTPTQVRDRLAGTADRPAAAVPDPALGWGVVNPVTALTAPLRDGPAQTSTALASTALASTAPASTAQTGTSKSPASNSPASNSPASNSPASATLPMPVALAPEPPTKTWAIVVAAVVLLIAAATAATFAGVRRAGARGWRLP
jgi:hypothetical protein